MNPQRLEIISMLLANMRNIPADIEEGSVTVQLIFCFTGLALAKQVNLRFILAY